MRSATRTTRRRVLTGALLLATLAPATSAWGQQYPPGPGGGADGRPGGVGDPDGDGEPGGRPGDPGRPADPGQPGGDGGSGEVARGGGDATASGGQTVVGASAVEGEVLSAGAVAGGSESGAPAKALSPAVLEPVSDDPGDVSLGGPALVALVAAAGASLLAGVVAVRHVRVGHRRAVTTST